MGRRPSLVWTLYILDQVREGAVPYSRLVAEAAVLVPPGVAYRRGESLYKAVCKSRGQSPLNVKQDKDSTIRRGQRQIVESVIRQLSTRGRLVVYVDDDGAKMVVRGSRPL